MAWDYIDHPESLKNIRVYDDEFVKGMIHIKGKKLIALYVDNGIVDQNWQEVKDMETRRFRAFAHKEDLQVIFKSFQSRLDVYYVPAYSDIGEIFLDDITTIENLGINFYGSHFGNMQMLVLLRQTECLWRSYQCGGEKEQRTQYSTLNAGNVECISLELNGVYQENAIFPTEISTMYYDNEIGKRLFDELRRIFRKQAVKTVRGYYICPKAYEYKEKYRFCTIDIKSPPAYDLQVV